MRCSAARNWHRQFRTHLRTRPRRPRWLRSGQARHLGSRRRQRWSRDHVTRLEPRQIHRSVYSVAVGLHRRHGDQLQRPPLEPQAHQHGPGRAHHRRTTRQLLSQTRHQRQERRRRCSCDLRSRLSRPNSSPQMHLVPVKSIEQQSMLCVHRLREGYKADRVACINRIRGCSPSTVWSSPKALRRSKLS